MTYWPIPPLLCTLLESLRIQYDMNFQKRAAAHPAEKWAEVQTSLWTIVFINAEPSNHYEICFSIDHSTRKCQEYESADEPVDRKEKGKAKEGRAGVSRPPICVIWNKYSCQSATYSYQHICLDCRQNHKLKDCKADQCYHPYKRDNPQPFRKRGPSPRH